jgi:prevent-host-death family protein
MAEPINIYDAKSQLSRLVDRAAAGEEVVIARHGRPIAKLVPYRAVRKARRLGQFRGQVRIARDFDDLPPDLQAAFEGDE